jgi:hypothetical protein
VLLMLFAYMHFSLDVFVFRKSRDAIRERRPIEWRDPRAWSDSKNAAARWVLGSVAYLAAGVWCTSLFPDYERFVAAVFIAIPLVIAAWFTLMRKQ